MQRKANPRKDKENRKKFDPVKFARKYLKDGHPWDGHIVYMNQNKHNKDEITLENKQIEKEKQNTICPFCNKEIGNGINKIIFIKNNINYHSDCYKIFSFIKDNPEKIKKILKELENEKEK